MNPKKRRRLEAAGWKLGSAKEFLELSNEEATVVELKIALGTSVRRHRARKRISQTELAKQLGSSQSRVAKKETGGACPIGAPRSEGGRGNVRSDASRFR